MDSSIVARKYEAFLMFVCDREVYPLVERGVTPTTGSDGNQSSVINSLCVMSHVSLR